MSDKNKASGTRIDDEDLDMVVGGIAFSVDYHALDNHETIIVQTDNSRVKPINRVKDVQLSQVGVDHNSKPNFGSKYDTENFINKMPKVNTLK